MSYEVRFKSRADVWAFVDALRKVLGLDPLPRNNATYYQRRLDAGVVGRRKIDVQDGV